MNTIAGVLHGGRTGAQLGALAGPIGAAAGAVAGMIIGGAIGWWVGEQIVNQIQRTNEDADENLDDQEDAGACDECGETELPENPDDLLDEGWVEEETQAPNRRRFRNPETGEELEFDQGQPGSPGWRGRDHYHRPNPNATGKGDAYLDGNGNPVPRGSGRSHIPPGTTINGGSSGGSTS